MYLRTPVQKSLQYPGIVPEGIGSAGAQGYARQVLKACVEGRVYERVVFRSSVHVFKHLPLCLVFRSSRTT